MDDMQPEEAMVERLLERLETGIESAVSQERFKEAGALRDEISRMHMDDTSSVLKVSLNSFVNASCAESRVLAEPLSRV
jgi:hypothetical protein